MRNILHTIPLLLFCFLVSQSAWAQGTTTSSMSGRVSDGTQSFPGASVLAVHQPSGTQYGTVTNEEGYFRIPNMRVGGPYTLTVSFMGYEPVVKRDIFLDLGQTYGIDITLQETVTQLADVVVSAGGLIDGNQTGAETNVGREQIMTLPTVDRSLNDFTRLTPQANLTPGGGISIAGVNNRFNAIYIDGAVNNDVFGLANSGTNGGQAGISPISLDALEQIQVVVAPYDVTLGGFAGGGINAVTRSGKNYFEGSAYYYFRNEKLFGKTPGVPDNERERLAPFNVHTYGARLGGPIIKNKLFFFANVELVRDEQPLPFVASEYEGSATAADLNTLVNYLNSEYGYDPGGYLNNVQTTNSEKVIAKIDWNINRQHKLSARHSYVKGEATLLNQPSSRDIYFRNTGYIFPTTTNSSALELKSNFGNQFSNDLILGYTRVRDDRDILGAPFPKAEIFDGPAIIHVGTDNFSYSNIVFQDVYTLTNNFNWYKGRHTFTFGTHNEFFQIENLFTIFSTPLYFYFGGLNSFLNGDNATVLFGHEQLAAGQNQVRFGDDASNLGPTFNALQLAFYAQDEIQFNSDFKLTVGLRADIPVFLENPPLINTQFNRETVSLIEQAGYDLKGARASQTPNTQLLWSPRVGFNWDVRGDKTTQLRGGLGIFTSRVPWVWPGGMFIRNGLNSAFVNGFARGEVIDGEFIPKSYPFRATPEGWREDLVDGTLSPTGDVDLFVEDFKYPQVFRTNIAVDQALPFGLVGTAEFMYTKTLNNIDVKNVNLRSEPVGRLEGPDNRPIFNQSNLIDPTYTYITLVDNTNQGYTWNATAQVTKPMERGFGGSLAYSFTRAESLFDGRGFINSTNWRQVHSLVGRNNPSVGRSVYDVGSRIVGSLSYRKEYAEHLATTISLFYNGQSGEPFSYIYGREQALTNEESGDVQRALIYVPANASEIVFGGSQRIGVDENGEDIFAVRPFGEAEQQAIYNEFNEYIENDDYLSTRRGQYAEQNASRTPFTHIFDVKVLQDFFITTSNGKRHTLQVSLDVFNVGNLLNKNWGRRYFVGTGDNRYNFQLLQFEAFEEGTNRPIFSFENPGEPWDIQQSGISSARWAAQVGVRYSF